MTQTTIIEAKRDMYNTGKKKCFSKGVIYTVNKIVTTEAGLMEAQTTNDMNEPHVIGSWWRDFEIVKVNR